MSSSSSSEPPPANANEGCVGPSSVSAGTASACKGCPNQSQCASGAVSSPSAQAALRVEQESIRASLSNIGHIVLVLSGKGGVGKSTFASQLSFALSHRGYGVGLLDVDICGPSIPRMVGVSDREVHKSGSGWSPVYASPNLAVMSVAFLLPDKDSAVVWRGPRKNGMIKQFLMETDWGDDGLDYLVIDTPPGTSDEHISTVQFLQSLDPGITSAVVITTPEEVSMADVRKELNFCKKTKLSVTGVVENMSAFRIPLNELHFFDQKTSRDCTGQVLQTLQAKCPELLDVVAVADVFPTSANGNPRSMAEQFEVPFLGTLPLDPNLLKACDEGVCFVERFGESPAVQPLNGIVDQLVKALPVED